MSIRSEISRIKENARLSFLAAESRDAILPEIQTIDNLPQTLESVSSMKDIAEGTVTIIHQAQVTSVIAHAFESQRNLTTLDLPNCVELGEYSFHECESLTYVNLPLLEIAGEFAFGSTGPLNMVLPVLRAIPRSFMEYSHAVTVSFPLATSVGDYAFSDCYYLQSISIPNCLELVSYGIFRGCYQLQSIELPSLTTLHLDHTFSSCSNLGSIIFSNRVQGSRENDDNLPEQTNFYVESSDLSWYESDSFWSSYYIEGRIKSKEELVSNQ